MTGHRDDDDFEPPATALASAPVHVPPELDAESSEPWSWVTRLRLRAAELRVAALALLRRYLPNESQHLFALTLLVGVICGLVAVAFHLSIRAAEALLIDQAMHAPGSSWMFWTVISPTAGGLLAGAALTWIVPGARGSGIPQVKQAFAVEGGRVRFRDAFGKFVIGSIQIGSGASLGREGPTVQICAGAASLLARVTALPPRNMRRLTPVGVAAGIAAAFNAPIAAVTFTIEEIVGSLDHAVLSGVVVAAALAAVIERGVLGTHPIIEVEQTYGLDHPSSLIFYALLGGVAALVSVAFTDSLLGLRKWFRGVKVIPSWSHPAAGGLVTGLLAVAILRFLGTTGVTGGGYETLGRALAGKLDVKVLVVLCAVKVVATVFSYSSGGAGGVFAPSLFIGAMAGGAVGHLDVMLLDHEPRQLGAFALVGMGAVFAGVIRAPITSVLIIFEMTGGYGLVLPLMLANMTSYMIARRWRPVPIYEALLAQDGIILPNAAVPTHALERLRVSDAMTSAVITIGPAQSTHEATRIAASSTFSVLPIVDDGRRLLGILPVSLLRTIATETSRPVSLLMRAAVTIEADEPLLRAVVRMNDQGVRQLVVLDAEREGRVVGILSMSDLVRAHAKAAPETRSPSMNAIAPGASSDTRLEMRTLMTRVPTVAGAATVSEIDRVLRDSESKALLVEKNDGQFGLLLRSQLFELAHDEYMERLLIAADLARAVPWIEENADLLALLRVLGDREVVGVIVKGEGDGLPVGVVTRTALALALLDEYAAEAS